MNVLPADHAPAELKDKLLSKSEQKAEGKNADGSVDPAYFNKAVRSFAVVACD